MIVVLVALTIATVVGLVVLWPTGKLRHSAALQNVRSLGARITAVDRKSCALGTGTCQAVTAKLMSGPNKGQLTTFTITPTPGLGTLERGERIRVTKNPAPPPGADPTVKVPPYSFTDFDRRTDVVAWARLRRPAAGHRPPPRAASPGRPGNERRARGRVRDPVDPPWAF